ncbi:helix-turn-helix domain-containing protein [Candidatus Pyrohabitans sp.]
MGLYTLQIPTPEGCWTDLTRKYDVVATIMGFAWVGYRRYIALVRVEGEQVQEFLREVERDSSTHKLTIYSKSPGSVVFEVHATRVLPVHIFASAEVMMLTPIVVKRGTVVARLSSNSRALDFLLESLRRVGYPFRISREVTGDAYSDGLTKRQKFILKKAIQHGYYSYPRRITLTQLAEKLGVSKSYLSEALQIIESKLIRHRDL